MIQTMGLMKTVSGMSPACLRGEVRGESVKAYSLMIKYNISYMRKI